MTELARKRPEFRNINALKDLPSYRLPAGRHRVDSSPNQRFSDVFADATHHLDV
jgi:hypothetical protein